MNPSFLFRANRAWPLCAFLLAGLFSSSPAPTQELGPLFFTPEHRQELDRQRESGLSGQKEISGDLTPANPTLSIDGVVTRSSGRRTVWVNGVAQEGVTTITKRENPGAIIVQPEDGPAAHAKVGDTVDLNTGETTGLLGGGQIHIKVRPSR
ncbi:hypothetical protein FACS1894158_01300 [Betaproteobacteria bacterium]|nr:hypothetical protein FACS1894158_01300 [Betaproteobacteria bacterium]